MAFSETLKLGVKRRAHFACCLCKAVGVEVHHIIPEAEGGPDDEDNAAPLCPSCHETYGANPVKRKFIKEVRDQWYEICEKRYASDPDRIDELKGMIKNAVTYNDFQGLKDEIMGVFTQLWPTPRTEEEIREAIDRLFDQVWYNRHLTYLKELKDGVRPKPSADTLKQAEEAAERIRSKYAPVDLGPWDDFQWGMINGKLSALRWVLGDDWDFLDT